jgi:hypothetical protein
MAVLGQSLPQPEEGWMRYDDTDVMFNYVGSWTHYSTTSYNGTRSYGDGDSGGNVYITFTFSGSSLRIIGANNEPTNTLSANNHKIIIDGVEYQFANNTAPEGGGNVSIALLFEKSGLSDGTHTVKVIPTDTKRIWFDAVDVMGSAPSVNIGDKLTEPETGWKRIDSTDSFIAYDQNWVEAANVDAYGGSTMGANKATNATMKFKFHGTKLRLLIGSATSYYYSDKIQITVDDLPAEFFTANAPQNVEQVLQYQKIGLAEADHEVEIKVINSSPTASVYDMRFDAMDIDETGYLIEPSKVPAQFPVYLFRDGQDIKSLTGKGSYYSLQGGGGHVNFGNPSALTYTKALTIEAWIKGTATSTYNGIVAKMNGYTSVGQEAFLLQSTPEGYIQLAYGHSNSPNEWLMTPQSYMDNSWHHVAAVIDASNLKAYIYVDGVLRVSKDIPNNNITVNTQPLLIGKRSDTNEWFRGSIDEVRIWNVALTEQEVADNYKQTLKGNESGLLAYWQLEEGTGTAVNDLTLNGINGTIIGTMSFVSDGAPVRGQWEIVGQQPVTQNMFADYGMTSLSIIGNKAISELVNDDIEVLALSELPVSQLKLTAVPKEKIIIPVEDILFTEIGSVKVATTLSGTGVVRLIISGDSGATWTGKTSVTANDLAGIKLNGYTPAEFNSLTDVQLKAICPSGKIRVGYYIEQGTSIDTASVDSLSISDKKFTITPNVESIRLFYELTKTLKPALHVSRDNGLTWKPIKEDEVTKIDDLPTGDQLRIKAVLTNGQEVHGISYSWI